jgi:hypothetical protein
MRRAATATITPLIAVVFFSSCATAPSPEQITAVGYGEPLTIDWQGAVKNWFFSDLKDPVSAQYIFPRQPKPGYAHKPPIEGGGLMVGYQVLALVNGKNGYGAYIGFQPYLFIFRDNQILYVFGPTMFETTRVASEAVNEN